MGLQTLGVKLFAPGRGLLLVAANSTFRSLHDAWADTTAPHGGLIVRPISATKPLHAMP
jgi:hypothetical protein